MPEPMTPETFLDACTVDKAVFELRPDYRALLLVVDGLTPPASGEGNDMATVSKPSPAAPRKVYRG